MNRMPSVRKALWKQILVGILSEDLEIPMGKDAFHIIGTVHLATLLAKRRGVDEALATAAMLLHDTGRLITGRVKDHQVTGLTWTRATLLEAGFSPEEVDAVNQAIATHTEKESKGNPLEEVVRDADVLEVYLSGAETPPAFQKRIERLQAELGLN